MLLNFALYTVHVCLLCFVVVIAQKDHLRILKVDPIILCVHTVYIVQLFIAITYSLLPIIDPGVGRKSLLLLSAWRLLYSYFSTIFVDD